MCRMFARLAPSHRLAPSIDPEWISDDPADVRRYEDDPLIDKGKLRAGTAITLLDAMHELISKESTLSVPFLLFHADSERVTDIQGSKRMYEKCSSKDKTLEIVHSRTHEIMLHAKHGPVVLALAGQWILTRSHVVQLHHPRAG